MRWFLRMPHEPMRPHTRLKFELTNNYSPALVKEAKAGLRL